MSSAHIKLPTIALPNFEGDTCSWLHYRDTFESLIVNNTVLSNVKKFHYLEFKDGGVCILVQEDLDFSPISLDNYCKEKDTEVCAVRLKITPIQLIRLVIYRSHSGSFSNFLIHLDSILNTWHSIKVEFLICGIININYLENCNKRATISCNITNL